MVALSNAERQRRFVQRLKERAAAVPLVTEAPAPALDNLGRDPLQRALDEAAYLRSDRDRWQADCAKAEAELRLERQLHLNTTKDKIVLQKELAALTAKPKRQKR